MTSYQLLSKKSKLTPARRKQKEYLPSESVVNEVSTVFIMHMQWRCHLGSVSKWLISPNSSIYKFGHLILHADKGYELATPVNHSPLYALAVVRNLGASVVLSGIGAIYLLRPNKFWPLVCKFVCVSFLSRFDLEDSETFTANHNVHPLI